MLGRINHTQAVACAILLSVAWGAGQAQAGGSLAGNGAGLVEQNAAYAYRALPRAISQCLNLVRQCQLTARETEVLRKIQDTVVAEIKKGGKKLEYVSAVEKPGFFDTAPNQHHRLSRTDLTTDAPIYFNSDQLYTSAGQPAVDLLTLSGILIHEFGHQAKFEDHEELNAIAAKVRYLVAQQVSTRQYAGEDLSVTIINYMTPGIPMEVILTAGEEVRSLSHFIVRGARCKAGADASIIAWRLTNEHWGQVTSARENGVLQEVYPFIGWLQLDCIKNGTLHAELHEVELRLSLSANAEGKGFFFTGGRAYFRSLR